MCRKVICIEDTFPNSIYNNILKIGEIYEVMWEGEVGNPQNWMNGQRERCYRLRSILPRTNFRAMFSVHAFKELVGEEETSLEEVRKKKRGLSAATRFSFLKT